ncbi:MAG: YcxB family protein [Clostridia bacterium]|nr:YcxB family protein [Clostridia bacterium]
MDKNDFSLENVKCTTYYTEKLMKSYRRYTEKSSRILSIIMCAIFAAAAVALLISMFIIFDKQSLALFLIFVVITAISVVNLTVIPNIQIKRSPYYDAEISYEFHNDEIIVTAKNKVETVKSHLGYTEIKYIKENDGCFYLHLGTSQAFIIEKDNLENITPEEFERKLKIRIRQINSIEINI